MKNNRLSMAFFIMAALIPFLFAFAGPDFFPRKNRLKKMKSEAEIIKTNPDGLGFELEISFMPGRHHNHPLMAFWIEDTLGNYIQSLYVAQSIAKGYFAHGDASTGRWQSGPLRRPAALPYWGHKRGIKADDGFYIPTPSDPLPDAVTGATPKAAFVINTRTDNKMPQIFYLMMEINQSWDWNQHWHNNRFPDDANYKTSSQPALVYSARVDTGKTEQTFEMKPIGHSHHSGANGDLTSDLSTITTALGITESVNVKVKRPVN
jgi:hypothetical protein